VGVGVAVIVGVAVTVDVGVTEGTAYGPVHFLGEIAITGAAKRSTKTTKKKCFIWPLSPLEYLSSRLSRAAFETVSQKFRENSQ
jgi:hypothetical protein